MDGISMLYPSILSYFTYGQILKYREVSKAFQVAAGKATFVHGDTIKCNKIIDEFLQNTYNEEENWDDWTDDTSKLWLAELWDKHQKKEIVDAVVYQDGAVSPSFTELLNRHINAKISLETDADYHPHSNNVVRDIVHPALYSYIHNVSPIHEISKSKVQALIENDVKDSWNRVYERSDYQWLPTQFDISENGTCTIKDYINGLNRAENPELYNCLEKLFEVFLPRFEYVVTFGKHYRVLEENADMMDYGLTVEVDEKISLKGKSLQVITKIVDYELQPGQSYEGVWHVEGMSHEHIVATGLHITDRDDSIQGGEILFKRALSGNEGGYIFESIPQSRPIAVDQFVEDAMIPLGTVATKENRLIVFPNSHVHKVKQMTNTGSTLAKRRIVVFFLVDPDVQIVSTSDVPDQRTKMSLDEAKAHRLKLMNERKYHKQDWNVRAIELCEH